MGLTSKEKLNNTSLPPTRSNLSLSIKTFNDFHKLFLMTDFDLTHSVSQPNYSFYEFWICLINTAFLSAAVSMLLSNEIPLHLETNRNM